MLEVTLSPSLERGAEEQLGGDVYSMDYLLIG